MTVSRNYRRGAWLQADFSSLVAALETTPHSFIEHGLGRSTACEIALPNERFAQLVWRELQAQHVEVWLSYDASFKLQDLAAVARALELPAEQFNQESGKLAWSDDFQGTAID
ncbi:MAG: hypothetical protein V4772_02400 [Pseudomonadota bacterium]